MDLVVYVPEPESFVARKVAPQTAIVAEANSEESGQIYCSYEGAIYQQANLGSYFDRIFHAADRLIHAYPTVSKSFFHADELIPVADFDGTRKVVTSVTDEENLFKWSGERAQDLMGIRYDPGPIDWETATQLVHNRGRLLGGRRHRLTHTWVKSLAGQAVRFDHACRQAMVFDHEDPRLPRMLEAAGIGEHEIAMVLGLPLEEMSSPERRR